MRRLTLVLVAIGFVAFVKTARADKKIMPGALCQPVGEGGSATFVATGTGRFMNAGPKAGNAICPFVRDDATVTRGTDDSWNSNDVVVTNQTSDTLGCMAYSANAQGSAFFVSSNATSVRGTTTLTLDPVTRFANGSYFLVCNVPGPNQGGVRSGILSYRIDEVFPANEP